MVRTKFECYEVSERETAGKGIQWKIGFEYGVQCDLLLNTTETYFGHMPGNFSMDSKLST